MTYVVYRYYDSLDTLLYIGCSIDWEARLRSHKDKAWKRDIVKILLSHYPSHKEALEAEWVAIDRENPLYNVDRSIDGRHFPSRRKRPPLPDPDKELEEMAGNLGLISPI